MFWLIAVRFSRIFKRWSFRGFSYEGVFADFHTMEFSRISYDGFSRGFIWMPMELVWLQSSGCSAQVVTCIHGNNSCPDSSQSHLVFISTELPIYREHLYIQYRGVITKTYYLWRKAYKKQEYALKTQVSLNEHC